MRLKAGNLSWMLVKSFSATESKNAVVLLHDYLIFQKIDDDIFVVDKEEIVCK